MRQKIRLTESDLHKIIKESVNRILNEIGDTHESGEGDYALGLDAADKAEKLGRWQQADNLRQHAARYFNKRYGTEEFGMSDDGSVGYLEPDFEATYTPYSNLHKESDGIKNFDSQGERNRASDSVRKKYDDNQEIEKRASIAKAYPRKRMTGGIKSYNNFNNYMNNR